MEVVLDLRLLLPAVQRMLLSSPRLVLLREASRLISLSLTRRLELQGKALETVPLEEAEAAAIEAVVEEEATVVEEVPAEAAQDPELLVAWMPMATQFTRTREEMTDLSEASQERMDIPWTDKTALARP